MGGKWLKTTVGEFCPLTYGKNLPEKRRKQGTYQVYGSNGPVGFHNKPLVKGEGIVIGRKGTVGAIHYVALPFWSIDTTFYVTNSEDRDLRFTYYLLESLGLEHMNTDSAVPGLNRDAAHARKILVPGLYEQRAIAHILGSLDDKIELNRQMAQTLESIARAIFKSWFVDFDPVKAKMEGKQPEGMTEEIAALFPDRLVDSELGMIPEGWEYKALGDMINIFDSKRIPLSRSQRKARQGKYPYYGATSIMDYVDDYIFDGVYVLIGEDGSVKKPDGTPFLQYVSGKIWVNNHAHVIQGKRLVTSEYIYLFLSRFNIGPFITGAVQPKLNQGNLKLIPIISPDDKIMELFNETISIVFKKIICLQKECKTLQGLRDTLLPQLISGKIRVNQPEDAAA
ncbi:restriction endonuclease subunit S [Thiolapillus sp.]|uniref:restriction endonuclease subunit S n=11 Tax=Thiolapillus sp. TaxID=2017437 RepID=UPI003AF62928